MRIRSRPTAIHLRPAPSVAALLLVICSFFFSNLLSVQALYEDEVGLSDFLLATAGHGKDGILYSQLTQDGKSIITSSSYRYPFVPDPSDVGETDKDDMDPMMGSLEDEGDNGCYLTSRDVENGKILWRRDVCTTTTTSTSRRRIRHAVFSPQDGDTIHTLDDVGMLQVWDKSNGEFLFGHYLHEEDSTTISSDGGNEDENDGGTAGGTHAAASGVTTTTPRLVGFEPITTTTDGGDGVTKTTIVGAIIPILDDDTGTQIVDERITFHNVETGEKANNNKDLTATEFLSNKDGNGGFKVKPSVPQGMKLKDGSKPEARILDLYYEPNNDGLLHILAGYVFTTDDGRRVTSGIKIVDVALMAEGGKWTIKSSSLLGSKGGNNNNVDVSALPMLVSTLRIVNLDDDDSGGKKVLMGIATSGTDILSFPLRNKLGGGDMSKQIPMAQFHPMWTSITEIIPTRSAGVMILTGQDARYRHSKVTQGLFTYQNDMWVQVYDDEEETQFDSVNYCSDMNVMTTVEEDSGNRKLFVWKVGDELVYRKKVGGKGRKAMKMFDVDDNLGITLKDGNDVVSSMQLMLCTEGEMKVLVMTKTGTTHLVKFDGTKVDLLWTTEESLASITSALFLDESHSNLITEDEEEDEFALLQKLTLTSRIQSQIHQVTDFFSGGFVQSFKAIFNPTTSNKARDYAFGLAKVAVLLSQPMHKVIGIDTSSHGSILYTQSLNTAATWHRIIHGTSNAQSGVGGIHGAIHSHEVLVLSYIPSITKDGETIGPYLEWICFDGTRGKIHSSGTLILKSTVIQLVPLSSHSHGHGGCRQLVAVLHEDDSVSVVPDDDVARTTVVNALGGGGGSGGGADGGGGGSSTKNGMYVHRVDRVKNAFYSMKILSTATAADDDGADDSSAEQVPAVVGMATSVGQTSFDPSERIVSVTYPQRDEVIQSPSTTLGDDSLLLKYLNPHLCVVITIGNEETYQRMNDTAHGVNDDGDGDGWYGALGGPMASTADGVGTKGEQQKKTKKPLGATKPGEEVPPAAATTTTASSNAAATASTTAAITTSTTTTKAPMIPTLFVNVMDTVSGQILYRTSHSHAVPTTGTITTSKPPSVLITENWILYTYHNAKTRRTDLGVLTLHEGMIDKHGITAFVSPDQESSFSSLESPKPIVLSKVYGVAKAVTALGVTQTKNGISMKHVLLATVDDKVVSVDRRMLDPRRPSGEVKESEKKEGLMRYSPLIPLISLRTPSHTLPVHAVKHILSTSASVESQSLILAYGGPDIFFTRMAPSKGFDMLPDSFNRGLLSVVVLGLVVVMMITKRMSGRKMVTLGWS